MIYYTPLENGRKSSKYIKYTYVWLHSVRGEKKVISKLQIFDLKFVVVDVHTFMLDQYWSYIYLFF